MRASVSPRAGARGLDGRGSPQTNIFVPPLRPGPSLPLGVTDVSRAAPRLEHELRLQIEQILLQSDGIAMRVDEALHAGVKAVELRRAALADVFDRRQLVHALAGA